MAIRKQRMKVFSEHRTEKSLPIDEYPTYMTLTYTSI